jgi:hypothetical protein
VVIYQDHPMQFRDDGWLNATSVALKFGKDPYHWLRQVDVLEYICALADDGNSISSFLEESNKINELYKGKSESPAAQAKRLRLAKQTKLVKTKQGGIDIGGGTWLHPDLAIVFARWLDVKFAVWCDKQIKSIIQGAAKLDWGHARRHAATQYLAMSEVLQEARQRDGKDTERHHYMNEAKLLNGVITGYYVGRERDPLCTEELEVVSYLETHNSVLIGRGIPYDMRKQELKKILARYQQRHMPSSIKQPKLKAKNALKIKAVSV